MIMSRFRALIILIRLGSFITTNANEFTMFANQPLHLETTPNAPLDAVKERKQQSQYRLRNNKTKFNYTEVC